MAIRRFVAAFLGTIAVALAPGTVSGRVVEGVSTETGARAQGALQQLVASIIAGYPDGVAQAIDAGADVNYQIPDDGRAFMDGTAGLTALRIAQARNHGEIVELLRAAGGRQ